MILEELEKAVLDILRSQLKAGWSGVQMLAGWGTNNDLRNEETNTKLAPPFLHVFASTWVEDDDEGPVTGVGVTTVSIAFETSLEETGPGRHAELDRSLRSACYRVTKEELRSRLGHACGRPVWQRDREDGDTENSIATIYTMTVSVEDPGLSQC